MGDSRVQQFVPIKYNGTDISTKIPNTPIKVDRLKPTINTETLAANKTLVITDYITQWLNPDGTTRTITMPAEASSTYLFFIIYNTGTVVGVNLNIEDDASGALITINYDEAAVLTCNGTTWIATKFSTGNGTALDLEVKEENTSAISKGQVTYISGATGVAYPNVGLADCEDANKVRVAGIAIADITQNSTGLTRCCGTLEDIDTRSSNTDINPNAETWTAGDQLWLSGTPGGMTKVRPTSGRSIKVATALTNSSINGKLLIKLHENPVFLAAASGEDIIFRMGDNAGANKISFKDYANNEVGNINSDGIVSFIQVESPVIKTSAYTAAMGDSILADTDTTAAFTITLPASASPGDIIHIYDAKGNFAVNNLTIARNGLNIRGVAADLTLDVNWSHIKLIYVDATTGWRY